MQLVIADTGPINYLILTQYIDLLPALFDRVILPAIVRDELKHRKAPPAVQRWIASPPSWAEVRQNAVARAAPFDKLDPGEEDVIALAVELHADLILMDDREGALVARSKGFRVAGTRQNRELELKTGSHTYDQRGRYTVAVKVIDIFGNDTMTLVPVNVG